MLVEQLSDHAERYRRAYIAGDATAEHLARTALTVLANAAPNHDPALVRGALRSSLVGAA
jgi:hypothetical protein